MNNNIPQIIPYTPSALTQCFSNSMKLDIESRVLTLQGIYTQDPQNKLWGGFYYDRLTDEHGSGTMTIAVVPYFREYLNKVVGKKIVCMGIVKRRIRNSFIEVYFEINGILKSEESDISDKDREFWRIQNLKSKRGKTDVTFSLRQDLVSDRRPKIGLVWASTSITRTEFSNALGNAGQCMTFEEYNTSFANVEETVGLLKRLDGQYAAIALIRGGGSGLEVFNDNRLLQTVATMRTPIISAVGHAEDQHNLKLIADCVCDTPTALGKYFSDIVETVTADKARSRAFLVEQVKTQFSQQMNEKDKQIESLRNHVTQLSSQLEIVNKNLKNKDDFYQKREATQSAEMQQLNKSLSDQISFLKTRLERSDKETEAELDRRTLSYRQQSETLGSQLNQLNQELQQRMGEIDRLRKAAAGGIRPWQLAVMAVGSALVGYLLSFLF